LKNKLDAAGLRFRGAGVVGVMRPPLDSTQFGLLAGLAQPSGQIKFTFDDTTAKALMAWINETRTGASAARLFQRPPSLYRMRPGDSGTGTMNACRE
jgi:hypothetical protein